MVGPGLSCHRFPHRVEAISLALPWAPEGIFLTAPQGPCRARQAQCWLLASWESGGGRERGADCTPGEGVTFPTPPAQVQG